MRIRSFAVATVAMLLLGGGALAQDTSVEEVVVTGSRLRDYEPTETPAIVLKKRADNVITSIRVVCDTRDPVQRKAEMVATLKALVNGAAAAGIEFVVEDDDVVGRFEAGNVERLILPDAKPDTSYTVLTLKTKVLPGDTFSSIAGRIDAFVKKTPKAGRTEILRTNSWDLTLIGPARYRGDIIALVAEDANKTAAAFGSGYSVIVEGLTLPVSWYQSGPLELALYIPYRQTVTKGN